MGSYSLAWQWQLLAGCHALIQINTLEFLATLVTLWLDILQDDTHPESCILSQMDSTSTAGWLCKSCFKETDQLLKMKISRKLTHVTMQADCMLYSQWFEGKKNVVADALSHAFHLSDTSLTSHFLSSFLKQPSHALKLSPLLKEISCWMTFLLPKMTKHMQLSQQPMMVKPEPGTDGVSTMTPLVLATTPSLTTCPKNTATQSWGALQPPSIELDGVMNDLKCSWRAQYTRLSTMWVRPFGLMTRLTPDWTREAMWHSFYNANTEPTET